MECCEIYEALNHSHKEKNIKIEPLVIHSKLKVEGQSSKAKKKKKKAYCAYRIDVNRMPQIPKWSHVDGSDVALTISFFFFGFVKTLFFKKYILWVHVSE